MAPFRPQHRKASAKKELNKTTTLPSHLLEEVAGHAAGADRFKFRGYTKQTLNRKAERKQKRMDKKQKRNVTQMKRKEEKMENLVAQEKPAEKVKEQTPPTKMAKTEKAKTEKTTKESEAQKLARFAESNPELYARLASKNLLSLAEGKVSKEVLSTGAFDEDDKIIAMYAKRLGIKKNKRNKVPQSLVEDGLGDLFDDLELAMNDVGGEEEDGDMMAMDEEDDLLEEDELEEDEDEELLEEQEDVENLDEDELLEDDDDDDMMSDDDMLEEEDLSEDEEPFEDSDEEDLSESEISENSFEPPKEEAPAKYVPPHLRQKDNSKSEQLQRLKKQLQGSLNKLSESNIESIVLAMEQAYVGCARRDFVETLTDLLLNATSDPYLQLPDAFAQLHAAFISAITQALVGVEFSAFFVQSLLEKLEDNREKWSDLRASLTSEQQLEDESLSNASKTVTNLTTLMAYLYNFQVVSCVLIYDVIRQCVTPLNELHVEMLLRLLKTCGFQLRSDDPSSLKDIIIAVQSAVTQMDSAQLTSRCKFMIETITDIKNNKKNKQKNGQAATSINMEKLNKFLQNLGKKRTIKTVEPLRFTLKDMKEASTRGKWWLVGAAWTGRDTSATTQPIMETSSSQDKLLEQQLLKLARAQGMNTDIRRSIFVILMSSEDCVDAYEKLMRLNLKDKQDREIVKVLMHCCAQEQLFNPYYAFVGQKFCEYAYSFKVTFQFALWDFFKEIDENAELNAVMIRKISHLAKMFAVLVSVKAASLSLLRILNFTLLSKAQILFNQILFLKLFEISGDAGVFVRKLQVLFKESLHLGGSVRPEGAKKDHGMNVTLIEGLVFFMDQFLIKPLQSSSTLDALITANQRKPTVSVVKEMKDFLTRFVHGQ